MPNPAISPDTAHLDLSSTDTDDLFASPSRPARKRDRDRDREALHRDNDQDDLDAHTIRPARLGESRFESEEAREATLQKEVEGVRSINEVIDGVVAGLERAKGNMDTVSRTVTSASTLLNTWIRILSQTEHNQRLLLDASWQGATQDVADLENESILKQQAAERRELEEVQRREALAAAAAARRAQEEDRRRVDGGATGTGRGTRGTRGTRGRGRVGAGPAAAAGGRGVPVVSSGYGRGGSYTARGGGAPSGIGRGVTPSRTASGIGRGGVPASTGRGRGVR
ncbi:MAG: hypothetical protein M1838_003510 [Thelocarpon superellum]|nr:MAG: hypothetical protein M1838_003510 [Thelocarpon superellum]